MKDYPVQKELVVSFVRYSYDSNWGFRKLGHRRYAVDMGKFTIRLEYLQFY